MLNSCGHALSQGAGSDFHPRCNWEATPPGYSACVRAWRWLAPHHGATPAQTYYGSPVKLEKYWMLAGVTECGRSQKWGCRGRFKPRHGGHTREDHVALGCSLLPRGLGSRRDITGREGVKGLLLVGHEKVLHGFGLTGDHGGDRADGARSLNHGLLLRSWDTVPRTGQREKEGLCASVGILKDFSILMRTLSHYSKSV